jgi:glycosyltransferase involved in cell wall biosynthesis
MRIAFVIDRISNMGGMERVLVEKMNYLVDHTFHEIVLFTVWHDTKPDAFPISGRVRRVKLNVPLSYVGLYIAMPWALHRFNKEMKRISPDVVVLNHAIGAFFAAFTSYGGRMVYESHVPLRYMNHQWIYPLMLKKIKSIVCLTKGDADDFLQMSAKQNCNPLITTIPNHTLLQSSLFPDDSSNIVVSAGRICYEKNFERMETLWKKIAKSYTSWTLKIHHVTKDMESAYLEGSIFVMTSRFEGFGMVLVEAMTCGLPCIAFDCPYGPREIIEDGKTGYLIPYEDDGMFIEKLTYLMEHPEVREQMGRAAKESVKRFSVTSVMQKWKQFYEGFPH